MLECIMHEKTVSGTIIIGALVEYILPMSYLH